MKKDIEEFMSVDKVMDIPEIDSELLGRLINIIDTICKHYTGRSFRNCIKIKNLCDDDGYNQFKNAVIKMGWGGDITSEYYWATYNVKKDSLYIEFNDNRPDTLNKEIFNAREEYIKIIELEVASINEYMASDYASFIPNKFNGYYYK